MRFSNSRDVAKAMEIISDVAEMKGRYEAELDRLRAENARLRAALEAEEQDADRYRWLRREAYVWGADHVPKQVEPAALWIKGNVGMDDAGIDEAIDTTRAAALQ